MPCRADNLYRTVYLTLLVPKPDVTDSPKTFFIKDMQKNIVVDSFLFEDEQHEYNNYTFRNSDLSRFDFSSFEFHDCEFLNCDLSMVTLENTLLATVRFNNCKMLGVDFGKCSRFTFHVSFEECILNYGFFFKNRLKSVTFQKCILKEVNFIEADLTSAAFPGCDLSNAVFERCNLTACDFTSSENYNINPSDNKIKKAKFSYPAVLGLLSQYNIIIED